MRLITMLFNYFCINTAFMPPCYDDTLRLMLAHLLLLHLYTTYFRFSQASRRARASFEMDYSIMTGAAML